MAIMFFTHVTHGHIVVSARMCNTRTMGGSLCRPPYLASGTIVAPAEVVDAPVCRTG